MNRWLRLYTSVLDNPKVQLLPADQFKGWISLLCVAKKHDGALPDVGHVAFYLRMQDADAEALLLALEERRLLDRDGDTLRIHNWDKWQGKTCELLRGDWAIIRLQVLERDNWICQYCGAPATAVDHIIARARGGDNEMENLVAACKPCNSRKRDKTPQEAGMQFYAGS